MRPRTPSILLSVAGGALVLGGAAYAYGQNLTVEGTVSAGLASSLHAFMGRVGIGVANPTEALEVAGTVKATAVAADSVHAASIQSSGGIALGATEAECDSTTAGTLRWSAGRLSVCNGAAWMNVALTTPNVNLARFGTASQSGTYAGGQANRGIDGNTNGGWGGLSVFHTYGGAVNWWQVDLGTTSYVSELRLWNRTDCCAYKAANYTILVYNLSGAVVWSKTVMEEVGFPSVIPVGVQGSRVRIRLNTTHYFHLAEVEVIN